MLRQRVITAAILVVVLLAALLAPSPWPFVGLITLAAACTLWEWLRLSLPVQGRMQAVLAAVLLAIALSWLATQWLSPAPATWAVAAQRFLAGWFTPVIGLIWIFPVTALVVQGQAQERRQAAALSLFAFAAVISVWAALVLLFLKDGAWLLISLLAMIWCADSAAYAAGRRFGRHKLAPRVSPGKTWEGAVAGVAAGTLWVLLSSLIEGSFGAALVRDLGWPLATAVAAFLTALSIVGDLFESLLKRRAGVKDSSQLLPGHGGVYDRIDALLPVVPVALWLVWAPAA